MSASLQNAAGLLAIALLLLAGAAAVPACGTGLGADWFRRDTELPLCHVSSFAVDLEGSVYVALGVHNHIQKYDSSGAFVTHWAVPAGSGSFSLRSGAHETIDAIAWRKKRIYRFAPDGTLIASEPVREANGFQTSVASFTTSEGITYRLSSGNWWPTVYRAGPGASEQAVVTTRLAMWLFSLPFPALLFAGAGVGLLCVFLRPSKRTNESASVGGVSGML